MPLSREVVETLKTVSTGTVTTILLKKGVRNTWLRGPGCITAPAGRIVGPAFTLSFVPMREDLASPASWASPISTRAAIEDVPDGAIIVADARGVTDAGVFGDILCARLVKRGALALVTDGVIRDLAGVKETGLPVWALGAAAPPSVAGLTFTGWQNPIGCGGVAIYPDDVMVLDQDGAVVIPAAMVEDVVRDGPEQERAEAWIMTEVERGERLPGLYPMNEETKKRYEQS